MPYPSSWIYDNQNKVVKNNSDTTAGQVCYLHGSSGGDNNIRGPVLARAEDTLALCESSLQLLRVLLADPQAGYLRTSTLRKAEQISGYLEDVIKRAQPVNQINAIVRFSARMHGFTIAGQVAFEDAHKAHRFAADVVPGEDPVYIETVATALQDRSISVWVPQTETAGPRFYECSPQEVATYDRNTHLCPPVVLYSEDGQLITELCERAKTYGGRISQILADRLSDQSGLKIDAA